MEPDANGLHSLRAGGASAAANAGVQDQLLRLWDTRARTVLNVLGNVYLYTHKVQGMTEAFTDMLYSRAKTSSSVHQKVVFTAFLERDSR